MNLKDTVVIRNTNGTRKLVYAELTGFGLAIVPQAGKPTSKEPEFMLVHVLSGRPLDNQYTQHLSLDSAITRWNQVLDYCRELNVDLTLSPANIDSSVLRAIVSSLD